VSPEVSRRRDTSGRPGPPFVPRASRGRALRSGTRGIGPVGDVERGGDRLRVASVGRSGNRPAGYHTSVERSVRRRYGASAGAADTGQVGR
jgi:hypothetical protein